MFQFQLDISIKQLDISRQFKAMHGDKIGNLSTSLKIRFPNASALIMNESFRTFPTKSN